MKIVPQINSLCRNILNSHQIIQIVGTRKNAWIPNIHIHIYVHIVYACISIAVPIHHICGGSKLDEVLPVVHAHCGPRGLAHFADNHVLIEPLEDARPRSH